MKPLFAALLFIAAPLAAAPPSGTFQRDHEITLHNPATKTSQTVTVLDRLTLKAAGETRIAFTLNSIGDDYDSCKLAGKANETAPGVYEFTQRMQSYQNALCRLSLKIGKDRITLQDDGGQCRLVYCGLNAALDGLMFPTGGKIHPAAKSSPKKKKAHRSK